MPERSLTNDYIKSPAAQKMNSRRKHCLQFLLAANANAAILTGGRRRDRPCENGIYFGDKATARPVPYIINIT